MIHVEVRGKVPGADGDGLPDVLVELEAGATTVRELIRLAVGEFPAEAAVRALDGLYALGVLDATVVEHALLADENLGYAVLGRAPRGADPSASAAACAGLGPGHHRRVAVAAYRPRCPDGSVPASRGP